MNQVAIVNEYLKSVQEKGATNDEWVVGLLSSIAHTLAVIADKMGGGDKADIEKIRAEIKEKGKAENAPYSISNSYYYWQGLKDALEIIDKNTGGDK